MTAWSAGYVSDIDYVPGFYRAQSPSLMNFVCLLNGYEPAPAGETFSYCELGCGLGQTVALLAAANPKAGFYGIDFNPAHIAYAQAMAADAGLANMTFLEASFEELLDPDGPALPAFDFVSLHGVYSWVSPAHRKAIGEFLARFVKPGGVVYVSYNSLPGWAGGLPIQRFLAEYAALVPERSDEQIRQAGAFLREMQGLGAQLVKDSAFAEQILKALDRGEVEYLAHEYLGANWHPLFHADVARELGEAKLAYAGNAMIVDNFPGLATTPEQKALLDRIGRREVRETFKDFIHPKLLRREIYVRGARRLPQPKQEALLRAMTLALVVSPEQTTVTVRTGLGEATLTESVYRPILDALAERPHAVGELMDLPAVRSHSAATAAEIAGMLIGSDQAMPALGTEPAPAATEACRGFNRALGRQFLFAKCNTNTGLASPLLGTGAYVDVIDVLSLLAVEEGEAATPEALAAFVWQPLKARGEKLIKEGELVEDEAENLALLRDREEAFLARGLPLLRKLKVA
jgi:SAM-dependent methyltransferase